VVLEAEGLPLGFGDEVVVDDGVIGSVEAPDVDVDEP